MITFKRILLAISMMVCLGMQVGMSQSPVKAGTPENQGIVFVGSSFFRYWTLLAEQMRPLPVLNRSLAGANTQEMLNQIDQLVLPYHPRIVVYYCGGNDVSSGDSAEVILQRTQRFIQILHEKSPATYFFYAAMQKTPNKRARWNVVDAVNGEMERLSRQMDKVGFINLNPVLFDAKGELREDLFLADKLHFRPDSTAYPEFAKVVKPILMKAWESGLGAAKN